MGWGSPVGREFTVLLVEDEPADARLARLAFSQSDLPPVLHHAGDGVEALEALRRGPAGGGGPVRPDLILLDLNMPRMNGREFLEAVKKDPDLRPIPVVMLTTSDADRDIAAAYDLGAAGYVVKPMDIDQFVAVIQALEDYWFRIVRLPGRVAVEAA